MARIMFMANGPWCNTGYGVQGKHLVPRLKALGHEVAYFAFFGLDGGTIEYEGIRIYPRAVDTWGEDILPYHMDDFKADTLITLIDPWVFRQMGKAALQYGWRWLPWVPIDADPVAPRLLEQLRGAHTVVPYAQFGVRMLAQAGVTNVRYVPHGVSAHFRPGDRLAARRALGIPEDRFVIGMVAANKGLPSRKGFPEQLAAFAAFRQRHPEALLYLHTYVKTSYGGIDIPALAENLGIGDAVMWSHQYAYTRGFPEPQMAQLYQAFDLLTSCSLGEGFGVPILEAQACGVPVVASDCSSMSELCWAGRLVRVGQRWWTSLNTWQWVPNIEAITAAYEEMYPQIVDPDGRALLEAAAVRGAADYAWDKVVGQYWQPLLWQLDVEAGLEKLRHMEVGND